MLAQQAAALQAQLGSLQERMGELQADESAPSLPSPGGGAQGIEATLAPQVLIDAQQCTGCGACVEACPHGAVSLVDRIVSIDQSLCRGCGGCVEVCPTGALILAT